MNNLAILAVAVTILVMLLIILIVIYFMPAKSKDKNINKEESSISGGKGQYNIQSIFKFMDFEKIEDNMIIQKKKRFLMVIECQGINFDLMSEIEKAGVESGFIGFLNSLKNPIQIHIQTRTINLERSINKYKDRVKDIEGKLLAQEEQLKQLMKNGQLSNKQIDDKEREIWRLRNLYLYGKDIVKNTESMSLNKNILRKKYYIVASYYYSNTDSEELLSDAEIKEVAFSELYTRCQSMIRVLSTTGVSGKVLNSYELADLLYNAYNRDSAETFGVDKAMEAGYDQLYVTAPDIIDKKISAIDKVIDQRALELAESAILKVNEEKRQELEKKEKNLDDLVNQLAQSIIVENADSLGVDVAQKSLEFIDKKKKGKEVDIDAKEEKTRTRTKKQ